MANAFAQKLASDLLKVSGAFTGNESPSYASVLGSMDGIDLRAGGFGVRGISATLIMDAAGTIANGAALDWYYQEPQTLTWVPLPQPAEQLSVGAIAEATIGFAVENPVGRIAALPRGVGAACHVYLNATARSF